MGKAVFNAAFAAAEAGDHAALAPVQGAATYMAVYLRLLRLLLLTQLSLMPTLLALSPSPLPLFSPEFNLPMLSHPPLSPLSQLLPTPMPTTMVPTVPTLPTPMLPMLVPMLVTPMLVPTVPMVDMVDMVPSVDTPMPSPWQLPKPNKSEKIRKK